jgi:hypothetical protein
VKVCPGADLEEGPDQVEVFAVKVDDACVVVTV